ncbi:uncharacterized protein LY79DRAFT_211891 [Colletotrichum navitas]|uniref:Uncharacterized protein n=1 Tax=Colletotrichum navitas TaxID=681940 RepID=A0AAD8QAU3_9PEZI|nr:uncharacterized protein LY79DRAFT_211891 [Colletotrichum navitas]KAK1599191.1 hypothetical protein LY79DRAFT_211891 [Colletotrichum navitas]
MHPPSGTPIPRNPRSAVAVAEASTALGRNGRFPPPSLTSLPVPAPHADLQTAGFSSHRCSPSRHGSPCSFFEHLSEFRDLGKSYDHRWVSLHPPERERYIAALLPRKILPLSRGHAGYPSARRGIV